MIIPIRCFTCGALIGDKWEAFSEMVKKGMPPKEALDKLGLTRYCCRRMLISHVELIDNIIEYYEIRRKAGRKKPHEGYYYQER